MGDLDSLVREAGLALGAGVAVGAIDNYASGGEVSPIVVVAVLLAFSGVIAFAWNRRAMVPLLMLWAPLPVSHAVRMALGLPDTLHPDTVGSLIALAAFAMLVVAVGGSVGALLRKSG